MRAVVQRVKEASVTINGGIHSTIGPGLLVLLGVERNDSDADAQYVVQKLSTLRIFEDGEGKMNRSVLDEGLEILLVSQFTLLGDVRRGTRPSFTEAARPEHAIPLYEAVASGLSAKGICVKTGVFQVTMEVNLVNNGPVTILLDSKKMF